MKYYNLFLVYLLTFCFELLSQQCTPAHEYITEKFGIYNIICLDEGPHGTIQSHEFIRNLLSDDKVKNVINYIIVEFANINYQDVLDRYIKGEDVPKKELQMIWRNTTQAHSPLFEMPVYLKLLTTIREINSNQPKDKQLRVIAGDPLINWSSINSSKQYFQSISQRDVLPSEMAIKYGIDSGKKVLIIFGGEHIVKTSDENKDSTFWTIPYYINKKSKGKVFTIGILNITDFNIQKNSIPFYSICEITSVERYDALYYADDSNLWETDIPEKIDIGYWNELNRRSKIVWGDGIEENLKDDTIK